MRFLRLAGSKDFYVLKLEQDKASWELISETGPSQVEPPSTKSRLPILAVIPDRYFFFYLSGQLQSTRRKELHQAVRLQLKHFFPAPGPGEECSVLDTGIDVLGLFTSPELQSFLEEHQELLARAHAVTTPFLLARALMSTSSTPSWFMHNPGDPLLLLIDNTLHYIFADIQETQPRLQIAGCRSEPIQVELQELILQLSRTSMPWKYFRIRLPKLKPEAEQHSALFKTAAALLIIGLLFCGGELLQLRYVQGQKQKWTQALDSLYTKALGPDYGSDPYGLLLYQAEQSKNQENQGLDFINLMGRLSQAAPASLRIQDLSLGLDSGSLQANLDSYDQMEDFLQALQDNSQYEFTLEQADTLEDKVQITLKVHY